MIDYPDDRGVGWRLGGIERERRLAAANEEDVLADAGADRIERHQRPAGSSPAPSDRLQHEQRRYRSGWHP